MKVSRIMRNGSHVCYARIQIAGAYGMSNDFVLFQDRFMVLALCIEAMPVRTPSGFFHKIAGFGQVFFVSRYLV